jgi:hypothetical protein
MLGSQAEVGSYGETSQDAAVGRDFTRRICDCHLKYLLIVKLI